MLNKENIELCWNVLARYGVQNQRRMIVEECAELQKAVCKLFRYENCVQYPAYYQNYIEELLDVIAVIQQMLLAEGLAMEDVNAGIKTKLTKALEGKNVQI